MAFDTRLELKLSQKLVLTPQLQQAIKLLALNQLELAETINQEMIENPFLDDLPEEPPADIPDSQRDDVPETDLSDIDVEAPIEGLTSFDVDEYFLDRSSDGRDLGYFNPGVDEKPTFETFVSAAQSLDEYLRWQLGLAHADDRVKGAADMIIGNINGNGYLQATDEEIAGLLKADIELIREAIAL